MSPNSDRTYYQYQLLRKVKFTPVLISIYLLLGAVAIGAAIWADGMKGLLYTLLVWGILLWLHYVIARTIFLMERYSYRKRWGFQWKLPWIGFLPYEQQYIGYRYWRKTNLLILFITFIVIVLLLPFVPILLTLQFLFWHLWLFGPRLYSMVAAVTISQDKFVKVGLREFLIYKA